MIIHRLGKKAVRLDPRTLPFKRYSLRATGVLPPVPAEVSWVTKVPSWPMYLNDTLGDCVCAAMAHCTQQWTYYAGKEFSPTDVDVLKVYEDVGGYVPGDQSTDNGVAMLDALNYWRKTGIAEHKILAFVSVDYTNDLEIREAIQLFGNVFTGIQLPTTVQGAASWTVPQGGVTTAQGTPGSWGGHCIPFCAASPASYTCVTWGSTLKLSHNFNLDYTDEMYAVLSQDWIETNGLSPSQFNLKQLMADLALVTAAPKVKK